MRTRTAFRAGDLVRIRKGGKVYLVSRRLPGDGAFTGRPDMYTLAPAAGLHPDGAHRLHDGLRRYAFDELLAVA